jgi:hypothetical protein
MQTVVGSTPSHGSIRQPARVISGPTDPRIAEAKCGGARQYPGEHAKIRGKALRDQRFFGVRGSEASSAGK